MSDPNRAIKRKARALAHAEGISYTTARRRIAGSAGHALTELAADGVEGPTRDPAMLRDFFLHHSAVLFDLVPERIAAPLLGHIYGACLRRNPYSLVLAGPAAVGKSTLAMVAMHHLGHDHPTLTGQATPRQILTTLSQEGDTVVFVDDVDETSTLDEILAFTHDTAQLVAAAEAHLRHDAGLPRTSVLITTELRPSGAEIRRCALVPVRYADRITHAKLLGLSSPESRAARATLFASMAVRARNAELTRHVSPRGLDGAFDAARAGWATMCDFLLEAGAVSDDERRYWVARAERGLNGAQNEHRDALADTPGRTTMKFGEYLDDAVASTLEEAGLEEVDVDEMRDRFTAEVTRLGFTLNDEMPPGVMDQFRKHVV